MSRKIMALAALAVMLPTTALAERELDFATSQLCQLRSAFLGPGAWGSQPQDADQINAQLQRHFQVVLALLEARTESSLDQAVMRALKAARRPWTDQQRTQLRAELAAGRAWQIETLRQYAKRGMFPVNEGYADHAVPIFVDKQGTHCAVGYLMHRSGFDKAVDSIVRRNNLVVVTDVDRGPLVDWIIRSGLTQEEAALIQPAYEPPEFQATLADFGVPGTTINGFGLTVSNFTASELSFSCSSSLLCLNYQDAFEMGRMLIETIGIDYHDPQDLGLALGAGIYQAPSGVQWINNLDQWLFVGGREISLGQPNPGDDSIMYKLEYVVSSEAGMVDPFGLTSNPNFNFNFNFNLNPGALKVLTEISDVNRVPISSGSLETEDLLLDGTVLMPVAEREFIVTTYALAFGDATFTSLFHEFRIVPEPTSAGLLPLFGLALVIIRMMRTE